MGNKSRGLYRKFTVARTDGTDAAGSKHYGCQYFCLDLNHDPYAMPAIKAYAEFCRQEYPLLAADLDGLARGWTCLGKRGRRWEDDAGRA